ncbi:MAG: hypothetical protein NTU73_13480 [Ignavibacteriae bacterium]|nr:hypothetical protein [Ignavibacteriota bacterium]
MNDIIKYYRNNFIFTSESELGIFVNYCINIVEKYIAYLVHKGKIFLPLGLSSLDASVEVTSDIYTKENNQLIKFHNFFQTLENPPSDNSDFINCLNGFLFTVTKNNLIRVFAEADPQTYRIIRNLNYEIKQRNYYVSVMFDDKYIHRTEIDFGKALAPERNELIELIKTNPINIKTVSAKSFLEDIFVLLESQKNFVPVVAFCDLVFLFKLFYINNFYKTDKSPDVESELHYKFLFDSVRLNFSKKLNAYFCKKNFSEKEKISIYNIIEEFTKNLLNGGIKKSSAELTRQYFPEKDFSKYINKVEYCLGILINDLMNEIKETNRIG